MNNDYPLFSVIVDDVEIATVGSDDDAKQACGTDVVFIDQDVPSSVQRKKWDEPIETKGYYTPTSAL